MGSVAAPWRPSAWSTPHLDRTVRLPSGSGLERPSAPMVPRAGRATTGAIPSRRPRSFPPTRRSAAASPPSPPTSRAAVGGTGSSPSSPPRARRRTPPRSATASGATCRATTSRRPMARRVHGSTWSRSSTSTASGAAPTARASSTSSTPCDTPVVATLHTVLRHPTPSQRRILVELVATTAATVVMSTAAAAAADRARTASTHPRLEVIPHGVPDLPFVTPDSVKPGLGLEGRTGHPQLRPAGPRQGLRIGHRRDARGRRGASDRRCT